MTEERPVWRTGLAKDVTPSETHRARAWPGIFGWSEITCDSCTWTRRSNDFAGLVASAINHSPRVKVIDVDGQELADGAREQREARRRWDAGDATTASEAIKERLGGDHVGEDDDGMSARIRRAARAPAGLTQAFLAGREQAATEEAEREAKRAEPVSVNDAIRGTVRARRNASRRDLGMESDVKEPEPSVPSGDTSSAIRDEVRRRRRAKDDSYGRRTFGDHEDAGDGGKE